MSSEIGVVLARTLAPHTINCITETLVFTLRPPVYTPTYIELHHSTIEESLEWVDSTLSTRPLSYVISNTFLPKQFDGDVQSESFKLSQQAVENSGYDPLYALNFARRYIQNSEIQKGGKLAAIKTKNPCPIYTYESLVALWTLLSNKEKFIHLLQENRTHQIPPLITLKIQKVGFTVSELCSKYGIVMNDFDTLPSDFYHPSIIHGVVHTYRVIINSLLIGHLSGHTREGILAMCGSTIHDMARYKDGVCKSHGAEAVKTKMPIFLPRFKRYEISQKELGYIEIAVTKHSCGTPKKEDEDYFVSAMLKDADALDRCRIGDLDIQKLRFEESQEIAWLCEFVCLKTLEMKDVSFKDFVNFVDNLEVWKKDWTFEE
ncbi:hypothetical protein EIN_369790 [Entamoeba invadens IP1]|uniref:HD/PDEase domain-containing protein n=1 Tax=Entamoeba invadens IP1 TaxID=370355 RepID=A0A0A1UGH0_ENTIV|nr:hypothetical protein EIN_369790 [Entamoeba invadens IP1]ELP92657.1 hypothetical protein EIN_369790 [Entamoeba invadens IP1]|eukprot:XP_004259428.1 hypothetical protein EIN_369790 [Entamoeba invadens IP1]